MKNPADLALEGCYPLRPKYFQTLKGENELFVFLLTKNNTASSQGFVGHQLNNLQRAVLLTSLVQYDKIFSKFGQQQLVMVNYASGFNQSETGKYFRMNDNCSHTVIN